MTGDFSKAEELEAYDIHLSDIEKEVLIALYQRYKLTGEDYLTLTNIRGPKYQKEPPEFIPLLPDSARNEKATPAIERLDQKGFLQKGHDARLDWYTISLLSKGIKRVEFEQLSRRQQRAKIKRLKRAIAREKIPGAVRILAGIATIIGTILTCIGLILEYMGNIDLIPWFGR